MVEQRAGKRAADAVVEPDEHQRGLGSFAGEAVEVALAIPVSAPNHAVTFHARLGGLLKFYQLAA